MEQLAGRIYLESQRGLKETETMQRFSTFNFEDFFNEHKTAFNNLFICNETYLTGAASNHYLADENALHIFICITGGIDVIKNGIEQSIDIGELLVFSLEKNESVTIINPYEKELINYLHFSIKSSETIPVQIFSFTMLEQLNQLIKVSQNLPFNFNIGIFEARKEAVYKLTESNSNLFCYVINGAFEVEGRLLQHKDSLALWPIKTAELEALSNLAIIIVLEFA